MELQFTNIFRTDETNIGDSYSTPTKYFDLPGNQKEGTISRLHNNEDVPDGTCMVRGKVLDWNENLVFDGVIANFDRSRVTKTDSLGEFVLALTPSDTGLFFYHPNYGEVVIWNYNFQNKHLVDCRFLLLS